MSTITFENGLFIIAERTISYDFLYPVSFVLFFAGTLLFALSLAVCEEKLIPPVIICMVIGGLICGFTPSPHTVVDAFVDPTHPWSEITKEYELLGMKDTKRGIYTFKVLEEDRRNMSECRCTCDCRK